MFVFAGFLLTVAFQPPGFNPFQSSRTYIPHITQDDTRFRSALVLENPTDQDQTIRIRALSHQGQIVAERESTVPAGTSAKQWRHDLFEDVMVDYLILDKAEEVIAGVVYEPIAQPQNALRVAETVRTATHWRVYPSNWEDTFDGLILLNTQCLDINAAVSHHAADGSTLGQPHRVALTPGGKATLNLGELFQSQADSYVQVQADRRVLATAVKGSKDAAAPTSFLVGNLAKAMDNFPDLRAELKKARDTWFGGGRANGYRFQQSYRCFCPTDVTQFTQITVSGSLIDTLTYLDSGETVPVSAVKRYHSVEEMFALIEAELDRADGVYAEFDSETGFPTLISVDPVDCMADEEYTLVNQALNEP
ncbi:DUF6174 domain-containing protein [Acanthopleuribacter pedis]|uniref:Uncharacterized protein n=1 Tax=Acanthopleuribacter pedis TaxID=442870 RepID=A0A8J7U3F6_9BACT|nr:DUF6174 domain-containing protein [Acanthopleuribacter pedis]MBO1320358.1 hypothetical protein [Acanthopleuribacter pedis]